MTEKKEKCGLFAARSSSGADVIPMTLQGLEAQQHRGQESWGISVPGKPVFTRMGLVTGWHLEADTLSSYSGKSAIGHVRYSTTGRSVIENAQPIQVGSEFSIAHNGTLVLKGFISHTWPYSAGSLCSTASDLSAWLAALHGGRLLSADSYRAMTTPTSLADGTKVRYGFGVGVAQLGGRLAISCTSAKSNASATPSHDEL